MGSVPPSLAEELSAPPAPRVSATAQHIRGSSLLLVGRGVALALGFGAQVLLVRYLSKADYGALSYALAAVTFFAGIALFEQTDTLSRFVPLYRERRQYGAMFGSVALGFGAVAGLGALIALAILVGLMLLGIRPTNDPRALQLLLIIALLIPVQALDDLFTTIFAIFGGSWTIVLRQSLLSPGLRLAMVALLIGLHADVVFLVWGYLAITILGILFYAWLFRRLLRAQGLLPEWRPRAFAYPTRELFGFATPLMASTLVWLLMESSDALLLGFFRSTETVASFRAVLPVAMLNEVVIMAFTVLFTPLAARLYAREDHGSLAELYRQTALWMTVLSFPIFALTFSFARSVTLGLYGVQYSDSAPILTLLALGYFCHTCLGFNGLTLKIYGRLRYAVAIDIGAAGLNVAINLLLIPHWGALGAAVGTAGTMIAHNSLKQIGLWRYTGITLCQPRDLWTYGGLFALALALLGLQMLLPPSLWLALPLAALASLLMLWSSRRVLQIDTMFPELLRWPLVRTIWRRWLRAA